MKLVGTLFTLTFVGLSMYQAYLGNKLRWLLLILFVIAGILWFRR